MEEEGEPYIRSEAESAGPVCTRKLCDVIGNNKRNRRLAAFARAGHRDGARVLTLVVALLLFGGRDVPAGVEVPDEGLKVQQSYQIEWQTRRAPKSRAR